MNNIKVTGRRRGEAGEIVESVGWCRGPGWGCAAALIVRALWRMCACICVSSSTFSVARAPPPPTPAGTHMVAAVSERGIFLQELGQSRHVAVLGCLDDQPGGGLDISSEQASGEVERVKGQYTEEGVAVSALVINYQGAGGCQINVTVAGMMQSVSSEQTAVAGNFSGRTISRAGTMSDTV